MNLHSMHLAATCKLAADNLANRVQLARGLVFYAVMLSIIAAKLLSSTGPHLPSGHVPNTRSCCELDISI